jgi:transglutaminase-like putative cysteine protease
MILNCTGWQEYSRAASPASKPCRATPRCERFELDSGGSHVIYEAQVVLTHAADAYRAGQGVCRDFAHLAITFCRALNIPARYVFGYIPEIGVPQPPEQMDFAAWFEAYLDGRWHTFDARNNRPRIGRVVVGRGRDAIDVALVTSFGPLTLTDFEVRAERASAERASERSQDLDSQPG